MTVGLDVASARGLEVCVVQLTPASYECRTHHVDLTEAVKERLEEEIDLVYRPRTLGTRSSSRPFKVIVTCPGEDTDSTHAVTCTGSRD